MTLDDAREVWKNESNAATMSDDQILTIVRKRSRDLDRKLLWRDLREGLGGLVLAALIAPGLIRGPWLTRAGTLVAVAGVLVVVTMLVRARHSVPPSDDSSLIETLRVETAKLDAQIRLLETVLWWYIAPLTLGPVLMVAGEHGASWFTSIYILLAAGLAWGIYALNQRPVQRYLRPRRTDFQRLLDALDARGD